MTGKEINRIRSVNRIIEQHEEEARYTQQDWKRKSFDLAKSYGESLRHLDELRIENIRLKTDKRLLLDIIRRK